ncbi:MAG: mandelate racemase/muconate lactonizing enzyme family protein [Anaerolineae bacterium]|nr:mandelate racemase/muconate lactonizing enzyme family protein [Anaerolineae bacterium]
MKIENIEAFPLRYPEPNDAGNMRTITVVRIDTDDGAVGWGECVTMWVEASKAVKLVIEEGLAPLLIGQDPCNVGSLWAKMKDHCWWYGEGGIASFAISALDIALWDLRGKALGQPIYKLLGGKQQARLRACASTHPSKAQIADLARELGDHAANGYTAVKVGFGKKGDANLGTNPRRDIEYAAAVREAIGPEVDFMIDLGKSNRYDVGTVIKLVHAFEQTGLRWIEDPFIPDATEDYLRLKGAISSTIATCERDWTTADYARHINAGIADVFLMDVGRAEGITATWKVIQLLEAAGKYFNAHTWSSGINTAASIHLSAATSNVIVLEVKPIPNPMQHELIKEPITVQNGWIEIIEKPGLGVEIDEAVLRKYTIGN